MRRVLLSNITRKQPYLNLRRLNQSQAWVNPQAQPDEDVLGTYTRDLTEAAREQKLDPVIGRASEIRRVLTILSRRTKNNVLLAGEPGVGKTNLVEGIARRIVDGDVPSSMKKKKVLSLDLAQLMAGTKFQGEFEERFKKILEAIAKDPEIILFIDEAHSLVGLGAAGGAQDAANLLKPALARGDLHCVGATTTKEYRKYIEKDAALARRFQLLRVEEPTPDAALGITRGLKEALETFHGVRIKDAALVGAVKLSERYITDRFLPDKAIDLIDEACASLRLEQESRPEKIEKCYRDVMLMKIEEKALEKESDTDKSSQKRLSKLKKKLQVREKELETLETQWKEERAELDKMKEHKLKLSSAKLELETAEKTGNLGRASELKYSIIPELEASEEHFDHKIRLLSESVTEDSILRVVSKRTGIDVERMSRDDRARLSHMEQHLEERVVGQPEAIDAVASCIKIARTGLQNPNKPLGVFFFVGPTGVGKTELCKALAQQMFDSEKNIVRLDMQDYSEKHSTSKLIGAPPGYVGYDEGGILTEAVRKHPYSIVLFDEWEKAHPDVGNALLSLFDEGKITDSRGVEVSFKNTIVVITSNLGARHLTNLDPNAKAEEARDQVMQEIRNFVSPELLNRIDDVILFRRLPKDLMPAIVKKELDLVRGSLLDTHPELKLSVTENAIQWLGDTSYDPLYGARPVRRTVHRELLRPMSDLLIQENPSAGAQIFADISDDNDHLAVKFKH